MSLVVASFLFASSRCPLPCLFCGVLRFVALSLLRPFSGAFHVGCFPPSRASRGGKGVLWQVIGSVAAASLRFSFFGAAFSQVSRGGKGMLQQGYRKRCSCFPSLPAPLLVARLPSSRWKGPAGAKKRKLRCHYYPSPFGCLRPVGKVGKTEGGVTAFSRRFPLRRLLLRRHRLRASQDGKDRCGERGSEVFPLLPFAASPPSSPFRRTFPGGKGVLRRGSCAVAGPVCCWQRALPFSAAACCRSSLQQS